MKKALIAGMTIWLLPMSVVAEDGNSWYKSLGKAIGEKARAVQETIDPDGSLKEKAIDSYEASKQYAGEKYEAAEGYVNENRDGWKEKGISAYESTKEKAAEVYDGVKQGYEESKQDEAPPSTEDQTQI